MLDFSLFDLSGKKALVTGGAQGIGRACATALATVGADVAILDLDEAGARDTVAALKALGRQSLFVSCDVTDEAQVARAVRHVVEDFGRLDIAVNNAGVYIAGEDERQSKAQWDKVLNVNLTGTWLCATAAMRQMSEQEHPEGKIINIASIGAVIACSNGAYDASKAAVKHLTKTLAARWGRYNINVNCISPGYIGRTMNGGSRPEEERQRLRELTPLGYVPRTADLQGAVIFLASRASDFITGQQLIVDGGHTLSSWLTPLGRAVAPRVDADGELEGEPR